MRIRVTDLVDLFGPAVHLRMLEHLDPLTVDQMSAVRELWLQIVRLAEGDPLVGDDAEIVFGGAVVLTLPRTSRSALFEALVIDGRRRLVAWQVMLDASRRAMEAHGAGLIARTLEPMLTNPPATVATAAQRHVVLPSHGDREVFDARLTLDLRLVSTVPRSASGIAFAHAWLLDAVNEWLGRGDELDRAQRLARVLMHRLRVVVIEARAEENPLRIARQFQSGGVQAQVVDIVDQMLLDSAALPEASVERVYESFVAPLSDPWWRGAPDESLATEARHEQLLRAWTMAQTLQEVQPDDLAPAFARYLHLSSTPVLDLLDRLRTDLLHLRVQLESAVTAAGVGDPRATFLYRMSVLGCAKAIAVLVWLDAPERAGITEEDKLRVLAMIESWVMRRALSGMPYRGIWLGVQPILTALSHPDISTLTARVRHALAEARSDELYCPNDDDLRMVLPSRPFAVEMPESAARVVLEALREESSRDEEFVRTGRRVLVREENPGGEQELSPMVRYSLANLILDGLARLPEDDLDIARRTQLLIDRCIRVWPSPTAVG